MTGIKYGRKINYLIQAIIVALLCVSSGILQGAEGDGYDLYDYSMVKHRIEKASRQEHVDAGEMAQHARDLYRNKKRSAESIPVFKKALEKYPMAYFYFELGNALSEIGKYGEALKAYEMSGLLGYRKKSVLYYNSACAASLNHDRKMSLEYISRAIENGYSNLAYIKKDRDLAYVRETGEFRELIRKYEDILTPEERKYLGIWHASPEVVTVYSERYRFFPDGRFIFDYHQMECSRRIKSFSGTWKVRKGRLYLEVTKEKKIAGGKLVKSESGLCRSDMELVGGSETEETVSPSLERSCEISEIRRGCIPGGKPHETIQVDKMKYWRLSKSPDDF